ncbi:hypothetical protein A3Q56_07540 [Intoshia linei]|uniref:DIX domain-containing protein n=1 Tax=Intoshia linei TaxID=1819745 RepID=A0A177ARY8_9BILA|nr:hypothetical protein A3Q56_07540 [Intoshia linei]
MHLQKLQDPKEWSHGYESLYQDKYHNGIKFFKRFIDKTINSQNPTNILNGHSFFSTSINSKRNKYNEKVNFIDFVIECRQLDNCKNQARLERRVLKIFDVFVKTNSINLGSSLKIEIENNVKYIYNSIDHDKTYMSCASLNEPYSIYDKLNKTSNLNEYYSDQVDSNPNGKSFKYFNQIINCYKKAQEIIEGRLKAVYDEFIKSDGYKRICNLYNQYGDDIYLPNFKHKNTSLNSTTLKTKKNNNDKDLLDCSISKSSKMTTKSCLASENPDLFAEKLIQGLNKYIDTTENSSDQDNEPPPIFPRGMSSRRHRFDESSLDNFSESQVNKSRKELLNLNASLNRMQLNSSNTINEDASLILERHFSHNFDNKNGKRHCSDIQTSYKAPINFSRERNATIHDVPNTLNYNPSSNNSYIIETAHVDSGVSFAGDPNSHSNYRNLECKQHFFQNEAYNMSIRPARSDMFLKRSTKPLISTESSNNSLIIVYYYADDDVPYEYIYKKSYINLFEFKKSMVEGGILKNSPVHNAFYFKKDSSDISIGAVFKKITNDDEILPVWRGKIIAKVKPIV